MSVLLIAGSPTERSRSSTALTEVGRKLAQRGAGISTLAIRDVDPRALVHAQFDHADIVQAAARVADAQVLVVATPVYKAAYSGLLKVFLDLLPQTALRGKTVLPLATGGSPHHMLALDYALRPVLHALGARQILPGIYATDQQINHLPGSASVLHPELLQRMDDAVQVLADEVLPPVIAPVSFSQVQYCV